jgi:hypothetical protein
MNIRRLEGSFNIDMLIVKIYNNAIKMKCIEKESSFKNTFTENSCW